MNIIDIHLFVLYGTCAITVHIHLFGKGIERKQGRKEKSNGQGT